MFRLAVVVVALLAASCAPVDPTPVPPDWTPPPQHSVPIIWEVDFAPVATGESVGATTEIGTVSWENGYLTLMLSQEARELFCTKYYSFYRRYSGLEKPCSFNLSFYRTDQSINLGFSSEDAQFDEEHIPSWPLPERPWNEGDSMTLMIHYG